MGSTFSLITVVEEAGEDRPGSVARYSPGVDTVSPFHCEQGGKGIFAKDIQQTIFNNLCALLTFYLLWEAHYTDVVLS